MEAAIARWQFEPLVFRELLQTTHAFIAGSFVLSCTIDTKWDPNDMDVWLPASETTQKDIFAFTQMCIAVGYEFPPKNVQLEKLSDYGRLAKTIRSILTFTHIKAEKSMQLILLKDALTPEEVILNFDFILLRMWYDGNVISMTPRARDDSKQRHLNVALDSADVLNQSWYEWLRTLKRVVKYEQRGFTLQSESALAVWRYIISRFIIIEPACLSLLVMRLKEWINMLETSLDLHCETSIPIFLLSVCPIQQNIYVFLRPFIAHHYHFQIAWQDVAQQDFNRWAISNSCNMNIGSHTNCMSIAKLIQNTKLAVHLQPNHHTTKKRHMRQSVDHIVLSYISNGYRYMLLTTRQHLQDSIIEDPEIPEIYVRIRHDRINILVKRVDVAWVTRHATQKKIFDLVKTDIMQNEQRVYNLN